MHQIDLDDSPVKAKIHTGEKPFRCKICPLRFTQSCNLQTHYRRAHGVDPKGDPQTFRKMCQLLLQQNQQQQPQQPKPPGSTTSSEPSLPKLTPKPRAGLWECCVCDEPFQDRDLLLIHEETHVPEAPFECRYCTTVYSGLVNFRSHVNIHRVSLRQGGFSASAAKSSFQSGVRANASSIVAFRKPENGSGGESDVALNTNQPFVPSNDKNAPYKCVECKRNFQKQDLYNHMKVHLKQKNIFSKKSLKCEKCGRVFEKELTLKKHMDTVHPTSANALLREALRDQPTKRTSSPATTLKISSEVDLVPIEPRVKQEAAESALGDDEVNSTVSDNPILTQLLNSSPQLSVVPASGTTSGEGADEGGFVISAVATVDHSFLEKLDAMERDQQEQQQQQQQQQVQPMPTLRRMPVLEESLRRPPVGTSQPDQQPTGPAPLSSGTYNCVYCPRSFNEHFGFRQHMRSMHYNEKRHKCPECGKKFSLGITLATHMRIHTAVHPFTCIVCFKTFSRSASLNGHLSMHSYGEVNCADCGETLQNVFNYMKHIEKFHPDFLRNIAAYRKKVEAMLQRRRELIVEITRGLAKHQSEIPNVLARLRGEVNAQPLPSESFKIRIGKPYAQNQDPDQDEVTSSEGVQIKLEQPDSVNGGGDVVVSSASDHETLPALRAELRKRPLRNGTGHEQEPARKAARTSAGSSSPNLKRLLEAASPLASVKSEPSSD
uniref:Putative ovo n=1 Tax=Culex tarsalis TaxID=7177 RepID=A0A1Q3EVX0_CULTA